MREVWIVYLFAPVTKAKKVSWTGTESHGAGAIGACYVELADGSG